MEWCRTYRERGVDGLQDHRGGPPRAKLTQAQSNELGAKLHQYTPANVCGPEAHTASGPHWTVEDVAQAVHQWYGGTWDSRVSYQRLLARCGVSYQRTAKVYKSRRPSAVMDFEADTEKK